MKDVKSRKPAAYSARGLLLSQLLLLLAPGTAHAARISLFGVGESSNMNYYTSSGSAVSGPTQARLGLGGGVSLEFHLGTGAGVELGAVYLARKLLDTTVNPSLGSTYKVVQFPLELRVHPWRFLSLGAGAYVSTAVGTITDDSGGSTSYPAAGFNKLDYGLEGSLGITLIHGSTLSPFVEGRYIYGLSDQINHSVADALDPSLAGDRVRWREVQVLIGFHLGGGERR